MATEVFRTALEFDSTPMERGSSKADSALQKVEGRLDAVTGKVGRVAQSIGTIEGPADAARAAVNRFVKESFADSLPVFDRWETSVASIRGSIAAFEAAPTGTPESIQAINRLVASWESLGVAVEGAGLKSKTGLDAYSDGVLIAKEIQSSFPPAVEKSTNAITQMADVFPSLTRGLTSVAVGYKFLRDSQDGLTRSWEAASEILPGFSERLGVTGDKIKTIGQTVKDSLNPFQTFARIIENGRDAFDGASQTGATLNDELRELHKNGRTAASGVGDLTDEIIGAEKAMKAEIFTLVKAKQRIEQMGLASEETDAQIAILGAGIKSRFEAIGFDVQSALDEAGLAVETFGAIMDRVFADEIKRLEESDRAWAKHLREVEQLEERIESIDAAIATHEAKLAGMTASYELATDAIALAIREGQRWEAFLRSLETSTSDPSSGFVLELPSGDDIDGFGTLMVGTLDDYESSLVERLQSAAETFREAMFQAGLAAGDALADAIISGDVSQLEDQFADIGKRMGADIGTSLGFALAGPVGALIGNVLGQVVGDAIGKTIGGALASLLVSLGLAPDPKRVLGSFAIGPGGFSGIGGTSEAQAQGQLMLGQIEEVFDALNAALGGTVDITQNMLIEVKRNGEAILKILDTATGKVLSEQSFATVEQAVEAGLIQLLTTAVINAEGPMVAAFQEVLAQVGTLGTEGLIEAFQKLQQIGVTLQTLGGPADAVVAAYEQQVAVYRQLESDILSLNLSAEVTGPLLEELADKFDRFQEAAELNVLGQMADMAEQFGIAAERVKEIRHLEVELQFVILEATLKTLGIWKENKKLFNQLENAAHRAVDRMGDAVGRAGVGGGSSPSSRVTIAAPPRGIPVDVVNADDIGKEDDVNAERIAKLIEGEKRFQQMMARLRMGPLNEFEAARQSAIDELTRLQEDFGLILEESRRQEFIRLRVLEVLNPRIESAFEAIASFSDSLAGSAFAPGTNADKANNALAEFLGLLAAAEGGDLGALEALPQAAQRALDLAAQAFGTSTDAFEAIFNQITSGLDAVLGNQDSITATIQQQTLDQITGQTALLSESLSAQQQTVSLLQDIKSALQTGALSQASGF